MLDAGEKLCIVIAIGYGKTQGVPHKSKAPSEVADMGDVPEWFKKGRGGGAFSAYRGKSAEVFLFPR